MISCGKRYAYRTTESEGDSNTLKYSRRKKTNLFYTFMYDKEPQSGTYMSVEFKRSIPVFPAQTKGENAW